MFSSFPQVIVESVTHASNSGDWEIMVNSCVNDLLELRTWKLQWGDREPPSSSHDAPVIGTT